MFSSNTSQVSSDAVFIEDTFACHLYTGNGSTQTINNGIDLSTYGGMVWGKARSQAYNNRLFDTVRGGTNSLISNSTGATSSFSGFITSFNNNGFSIGTAADLNENGTTYASWTFRKSPKFFDVVTYTGDGSASKSIAHNLGSVPGCIIVKATSTTGAWAVWHRSGTQNNQYAALLEQTGAYGDTGANIWGTGGPSVTSSSFTVGTNGTVNASGQTYVAYIFAHNAGGFGLTGTDNVISCGSYTSTGSDVSVTLGYEPQFLLVKNSGASGGDWVVMDSMRGLTVTGDNYLLANTSTAEGSWSTPFWSPTPTGFISKSVAPAGETLIYIAIRRGPMKTPTSGTSVFAPIAETSSANPTIITPNFPVDLLINKTRSFSNGAIWVDRLRGTTASAGAALQSSVTNAEYTSVSAWGIDSNTQITDANNNALWGSTGIANWVFRRAPGFFDVVCYTGTGSNSQSFTHNLTVAPELVIVKRRNGISQWETLVPVAGTSRQWLRLNATAAGGAVTDGHLGWNATDGAYKAPTSSLVYFGNDPDVGLNGAPYVAYLFATCAGVSKVGSYTGTGATQTINCGFTGGARFVLIKRTDSTGDWYVWDTARGIVSANDPRLSLNSTAAEVTTDDSIDPDNSGFIVNQVSATNINVSSATYIYLAIA